MCSDQREAVLVIADLIDRNLPAFDRVAALAIGAELPAMNVCVTVCAMRTDFTEDEIRVALRTRNFLVHAAQRIAGGVVIEFGIGADRLPAGVGMTLLAGNGNRAMRIGDLGLRTTYARAR